ncbi:hypothetical protein [Streptomyces sp. SM12]|uniref:hypothetical protein n=1 Tax=Streptomyces sp. SM12 TaxID=1071602 RepID=UPI000CD57EE5|nr:hypothetical protein [Streptomyces sp. SM12]
MLNPVDIVTSVVDDTAAAVWGARWHIVAALVVAAALWGAAAGAWRRRAVSELSCREEVQFLPSTTFHTDMDEVMQQGARLGRITAAAGTVPQRARATRILLASSPDGQLEYRVRGPERAGGLLRQHQFSGVEVLDGNGPRTRPPAPRVRFASAAPVKKEGEQA